MTRKTISLHTLHYTKADLDAAPEQDRLLFLMSTSLVNEYQMLFKMLVVIIESEPRDSHIMINQANSAFGMLVVRMFAGRLCEGWKVIAKFNHLLKAEYEPHMGKESRAALRDIRAYFNPKGTTSFIQKVRDHVAFHSLQETVEESYNDIAPEVDLGDYISRHYNNTLYYSAEILHYNSLRILSGLDSHEEALVLIKDDLLRVASLFNEAIYSFVLIFYRRYLNERLQKLDEDKETVEAWALEEMQLSYFTYHPTRRPAPPSARLKRSRTALRSGTAMAS